MTAHRSTRRSLQVQRFVLRALAGGPIPSTEILAAAAAAGIPERTLRRHIRHLPVYSYHRHGSSSTGPQLWYWALTAAAAAELPASALQR